MLLVQEIVRSIFNEIVRTFTYSSEEEEKIKEHQKYDKTRANEAPLRAYLHKKGASFQYSFAMLYMLRQNNIKAYLGIYKGEGLHSPDVQDDYACVLYREGLFHWYIAGCENEDIKNKNINPARISIKKFKKMKKSKIYLYDPYDEIQGRKPLFGGFLEKPKWIIK